MHMRSVSILFVALGALASSAAIVAELLRVDDQWGLTGELTAVMLVKALAFVLVPYVFLLAGSLLARGTRAHWFIFAAVVVTLAVSGFLEIPHAWESWNPKDESYGVGAIVKYPLTFLALIVGFISFDMRRLFQESASNPTLNTDARQETPRVG